MWFVDILLNLLMVNNIGKQQKINNLLRVFISPELFYAMKM